MQLYVEFQTSVVQTLSEVVGMLSITSSVLFLQTPFYFAFLRQSLTL